MRRPQQIIDPKTFRKASRREAPTSVFEAPTELVTAFDIKDSISVDTKGFEVRDLLLAPGCATAEYFHDKKVRMFVVLAGEGSVVCTKDNETGETPAEFTNKSLTVGSFYVCEAGVKYRLCATAESSIQVLMIQDSKYEAKLTETEPAVVSEFGAQLNVARKVAAERPASRRANSKAAQQAMELAASKGKQGVAVTPSGLPSSFIPEGINAQPTRFAD